VERLLERLSHGRRSVEEVRRKLFEQSKHVVLIHEREVKREEESRAPMGWEFRVEDASVSDGFIEVVVKGRGSH